MKFLLICIPFFIGSCSNGYKSKAYDDQAKDQLKYENFPSYLLLKKYESSLVDSFKSENSNDEIYKLKKYINDVENRINKECFVKECVDNISNLKIEEIRINYYNFNLLFNDNIYPISNDLKCFDNKAVFNINLIERKLSAYKACNDSKIDFKILGDVEIQKKIKPENIFMQINGDADGDGEVDQSFTFKIAGKNQWYVITNGRSVYGFGVSNVDEIQLANLYEVK